MLGECLEIFGNYTQEEREKRILGEYVPKDGTYILVGKDGKIKEVADFRLDKKTGEINRNATYFQEFLYYDYHSDLISMNKPLDSEKIIHSNNYLSFWVKKESLLNGKLTQQVIGGYYDVLAHPERKCEKTKALSIYQKLEEVIGSVDAESLRQNREWIEKHIFNLAEYVMAEWNIQIDFQRKDYLKIFFEADRETYQKEGDRYFIPNIYNSNQYNVTIKDEVFGLPDNNQGMNAKKPFLSIKTRKSTAPYLLNREEVILQKQFFDYLMNFAAVKKYNVYVDMKHNDFRAYRDAEYPPDEISGFFLRIKKGKEVEIHDQDVVPFYHNRLKKPFVYENKLEIEDNKNPEYEFGKTCETFQELEGMIDDIFFSRTLISNYFSEEEKIKITDEILKRMLLVSRRKLFGWLHLGNGGEMKELFDKISIELIKSSILNEYMMKAAKQLNLRLSLMQYFAKGGEDMADFSMEIRKKLKTKIVSDEYMGLQNDREYYFAVGQMARYFVYLSKAGKKKQSLINPFLNARTDKKLKELLGRYYKKYNYAISAGARRVSRLYGMVECYEPEGPILQDILSAGFVIDNLLLEKKDREDKEDE